jgi:xylose isomerase
MNEILLQRQLVEGGVGVDEQVRRQAADQVAFLINRD